MVGLHSLKLKVPSVPFSNSSKGSNSSGIISHATSKQSPIRSPQSTQYQEKIKLVKQSKILNGFTDIMLPSFSDK